MFSELWVGQYSTLRSRPRGLQAHCFLRARTQHEVSKENVKEVDLYSAFIVVPHTQGAQVRITQCYLQITPYLHQFGSRCPRYISDVTNGHKTSYQTSL